jgi:hypothetical protein
MVIVMCGKVEFYAATSRTSSPFSAGTFSFKEKEE